ICFIKEYAHKNLSKGEETEVYQELREKCKRNIGGFVNINILVRNVEILWLDLSSFYRPCVAQLLVPSLIFQPFSYPCLINLLHESFLSIAYLTIIHNSLLLFMSWFINFLYHIQTQQQALMRVFYTGLYPGVEITAAATWMYNKHFS
ncbi:hypothetical protein ACJX0J_010102, partial [Zea mays]